MKIAHIVSTFPPYKGGMGNVAYHFALGLSRFKHQIIVFTPFYKGSSAKGGENLADNLRVVRLIPHLAYGNAAVLSQLPGQLNDADIIHLHYPFFGTAEIIACFKRFYGLRCRLVIHYHMDTNALGWKGWIFRMHRRLMAEFVLRSADAITCASLDYVKHGDIAKFYSKNADKFVQVPFGVDLDKFYPGQDKKKTILFVGALDRAHYFKGLDILLKAYAGLSGKISDYRLMIVGRGDLLPFYKDQAKQLAIADRVDFISDADDGRLAEVYRSASFLVLPSINRNEAFGLVLLEAMASGLPVIASNLPGVRSVFKNGIHGYLAQPGDVDDLSKKIWQMAESEKKMAAMGEAARKLAEERYNWAKAAGRLNELYFRIKNAPSSQRKRNLAEPQVPASPRLGG